MSIRINILNLSNTKPQHEWQVRVDRTSILGNPFQILDERARDFVCDKYEEYFYMMFEIGTNEPDFHNIGAQIFVNELRRLYKLAKTHGKLDLFCWDAKKRCHAETIKRFLEGYLNPVETEKHQKPTSQDHFDEPLTGYEMGLTDAKTEKEVK